MRKSPSKLLRAETNTRLPSGGIMVRKQLSPTGALVGALAGWVTEVTVQELTGHHFTHGILELVGAAAGLWRLDRRFYESLQETLYRVRGREGEGSLEGKRGKGERAKRDKNN